MAGVRELGAGPKIGQRNTENRHRVHQPPFFDHTDMKSLVWKSQKTFAYEWNDAVAYGGNTNAADVTYKYGIDDTLTAMESVNSSCDEGAHKYMEWVECPKRKFGHTSRDLTQHYDKH